MLKNIIFDMGNVLVDYDPCRIIEDHGVCDPIDSKLLLDNIFYSEDWKKMDLGVYVEKDVCARALSRLPERLHPLVKEIMDRWYDSLIPIEGMDEMIVRLKKRGFGIYLLSNAGRSKDIYWNRVPGNKYFDGTIVSAFEGCLKPEREIYEILLNRYGLKAEECLFIDDMPANAAGAKNVGMDAYVFAGDIEALEGYILKNSSHFE